MVRSSGPQFSTRMLKAAEVPAQTRLTTQPALCGIQQGGGILHPQPDVVLDPQLLHPQPDVVGIMVGILMDEKSKP
jgi:hypothetical protein